MSAPREPHDADRSRARDERRTRWPLLLVAVVLGGLLAMTSALERSAPTSALSAPPVADAVLPHPVLDEPIRCSRADERNGIDELRGQLDPAGRITSAIVFACPRLLAGSEVVYIGEVVGDVLRRTGGAWVQVNDDDYALEVGPFGAHRERRGFSSGLAVWLPDGLHEQLGAPGRYGQRGDVIRVEGVLLRADPDDGGGITVRAERMEVLAASTPVEEPLHVPLVLSAAAAAVLALAVWAWDRRRTRQRDL
jgi:hypothetical protein